MEITKFIRQQTGLSGRALADKLGCNQSTLNKQLNGETALKMETLRDISRVTNLNLLDLFQISGHLTPVEVSTLRAKGAITSATDHELAAEILRRLGTKNVPMDEEEPLNTDPFAASASEHEAGIDKSQLSPDNMEYHIGKPTPDGDPFQPDVYDDHRYIWDTYGRDWYRSFYDIAAKRKE